VRISSLPKLNSRRSTQPGVSGRDHGIDHISGHYQRFIPASPPLRSILATSGPEWLDVRRGAIRRLSFAWWTPGTVMLPDRAAQPHRLPAQHLRDPRNRALFLCPAWAKPFRINGRAAIIIDATSVHRSQWKEAASQRPSSPRKASTAVHQVTRSFALLGRCCPVDESSLASAAHLKSLQGGSDGEAYDRNYPHDSGTISETSARKSARFPAADHRRRLAPSCVCLALSSRGRCRRRLEHFKGERHGALGGLPVRRRYGTNIRARSCARRVSLQDCQPRDRIVFPAASWWREGFVVTAAAIAAFPTCHRRVGPMDR